MNRVEGIAYVHCERISEWPGRLRVKRSENGVFLTLEIGSAYISALEVDWWDAIRILDDRFHALVTGARFAVDVLMAISKPKIVYVEDKPKCAHPLCADSEVCIDNYDGGDDGDAWSGGFAENH